jgi:hypothetical protein
LLDDRVGRRPGGSTLRGIEGGAQNTIADCGGAHQTTVGERLAQGRLGAHALVGAEQRLGVGSQRTRQSQRGIYCRQVAVLLDRADERATYTGEGGEL